MFTLPIAVAAAMIAAQPQSSPATSASPRLAAAHVSVSVAGLPVPVDHLANARRAVETGALDEARREFVLAIALDRAEGRVPTESSFGLAHVLYGQSYNREAALVLARLADDAALAGDADTEARALVDLVWLNRDAHQLTEAQSNGRRLKALRDNPYLADATRQAVIRRVG